MDKAREKIVFFIGNMGSFGGTERVLSVIANGLSRREYQVVIVSLWGRGESFFEIEDRVKIYWIGQGGRKTGIRGNLHYLKAVLKIERPEFWIDVDMILGCYSFFLKRLRPELNWISWEHFAFCHPFLKNRLLRKLVRRLAARYADHLVVLTDADKRSYEKRLRPCCLVTRIYNPVPYKETFPGYKEKPMIFAAGRLVREKGFDLLIRSWELLEYRYPKWTLVIAGEGEDRRKLEKMAGAAGLSRLYFIGTVPDIERYYEQAAFLVLPSRYEGFGMTLAEAMCFQMPVVSYACPEGPKEIVIEGENGFLVPQENVEEFARKMELLMRDDELRRRMGQKAGGTVWRFRQEHILDEWERVFAMHDRSSKSMRKK